MRGIVPCWFSTRVFKLFFSSLFFLFYFVLFLLTKYARIAIFQSLPLPSSCALWNDSRCLIKEQKIQTRVIEKFCRFSSRAENEKVFTLWYVSPFAGIRVTIFRSKNWLLLERVLYRERERESHFRTVIASNNNVLIIIYSYARRSIICPFRLSFNTFANANSITARFEK